MAAAKMSMAAKNWSIVAATKDQRVVTVGASWGHGLGRTAIVRWIIAPDFLRRWSVGLDNSSL